MARVHSSPGSRRYARALAEAVEAEGGRGLLLDVSGVLDAVCEAWDADPVFRSFFLASEIRSGDKHDAMEKLVEGRFPRLLGNFLRLLLRRNRLALLPEIGLAYRTIVDELLGRVPVTITTAVPVPDDQFNAWKKSIRATVGEDAVITHVVKPEIIAGAVIRVGDRVADGSARRHLADLNKRIIERGMQHHALQS